LLAAFEFANPIHARQLRNVRKAQLLRGDGPDLDAAPFKAPVALLDVQ
jgi:hypothetical protein